MPEQHKVIGQIIATVYKWNEDPEEFLSGRTKLIHLINETEGYYEDNELGRTSGSYLHTKVLDGVWRRL